MQIIDSWAAKSILETMKYPRPDDPISVLAVIPAPVQAIMREAALQGFDRFRRSRALDPASSVEYHDTTKSNMIYDRICAVTQELIELADDQALSWKYGPIRRATEVFCGPYIALRHKRVKQNRGGRSANVRTKRQCQIRGQFHPDSVGQTVLPFGEVQAPQIEDLDRIWLTVAYETDDVEESIESVSLRRETEKQVLWRVELDEMPIDSIARTHLDLGKRIEQFRLGRSS